MSPTTIPFPRLSQLRNMRVGLLLWSSVDDAPNGDRRHTNFVYGDSHVWIQRTAGTWFAGLEQKGACRIACTWSESADGSLDPDSLSKTMGTLAVSLRDDMSNIDKTERVWSMLKFESHAMRLRLSVDGRGAGDKTDSDEIALSEQIERLLRAWQ